MYEAKPRGTSATAEEAFVNPSVTAFRPMAGNSHRNHVVGFPEIPYTLTSTGLPDRTAPTHAESESMRPEIVQQVGGGGGGM